MTLEEIMKTANQIYKHIQQIPLGEPFSSAMLLSYGTRANVDQTLCRLAKAGKISRITRGIFVRPKKNHYLGQVMPDSAEVVKMISKMTHATIQIHGAEAARIFELSTQVPAQPIFYTSGPSKQFKIGQLQVTLKHISPRKLICPKSKAGVAISALWYLGKAHVNKTVIESIRKKMTLSEFEEFKSAASSMPGWMADALYRYEHKVQHG